MAFVGEAFSDVNPFGGFTFRARKSRGAIAGALVIGAGTVAFAWAVATVFTMQTMVMSLGSTSVMLPETALGPKSIALASPQQRLIRTADLSRSAEARAAQYRQKNPVVLATSGRISQAAAIDTSRQPSLRTARLQRPAGTPTELAPDIASAADAPATIRNARTALPNAARMKLILRLAMANAASSPARDTPIFEPTIATAAARPSAATPLDHPHQVALAKAPPTRVKDDAIDVAALSSAASLQSASPSAALRPATAPEIGSQQDNSSSLELASAAASRTLPVIGPVAPTALPAQAAPVIAEASSQQQSGLALAGAAALAEVAPAMVLPIPTPRPADGASQPAGASGQQAEIALASADSSDDDDSDSSAEDPFNLVLTNPDGSIPLPMARPGGMPRSVDAPPAGRAANRPAEPVLAYARPDDEDDDDNDMPTYRKPLSVPMARNGVAVYDIEAGMVYLPNGERLEAHSGLGAMRDNPRYVNRKNRGPTPPHTYDLTMRESLFHGVQALRLTPVGGEGAVYNRVGLLAHTYMLGKRGDSNGCVSFKDYRRFLAAYKRGEVRQLVVVPRMPASGTATASASRSFFGLFSR